MAKKPHKRATTHSSFLANKFFIWSFIIISALAVIGYMANDFQPKRNGGTWYGYSLGVFSVILILWLTMLGMRKRWFTNGHWSLKRWTSAHVYLGLALIFTGTLHTGFQFGLNIHTLAYFIMMSVIISGLFGIFIYARVPRRMSKNRGDLSQAAMLDELSNLNRVLRDTAQPLDDKYINLVQTSITKTKLGGSIFKRFSGKDKNCATAAALKFFRAELRTTDNTNHGPLLDLISVLERKNALLHRVRRHIRHKAILGTWLYWHIPLTFALLAALTAHIVSVFYYS